MLTLLPDLGDLLRLSPQYNAATLIELARRAGAREVLWASDPDPDHPARSAFQAAGFGVTELAPDWGWAEAEHRQVQEFLGQYPQGRERLRAAGQLEAPLRESLLGQPLTPERVVSPELLEAVRTYHAGLTEQLGEGPGNKHRGRRLGEVAAALDGRSGLALVALDDLPDLLERLPGAALPNPAGFAPGEASRLRALADRAARLDEQDDLDALVTALLRESGDAITPRAELEYVAAGAYLATGDLASARDLLESAAHTGAELPRTLPGLILARLGQVRDAQGERDLARRAYAAVLALEYAPEVARQAAQQGQDVPFELSLDRPAS